MNKTLTIISLLFSVNFVFGQSQDPIFNLKGAIADTIYVSQLKEFNIELNNCDGCKLEKFSIEIPKAGGIEKHEQIGNKLSVENQKIIDSMRSGQFIFFSNITINDKEGKSRILKNAFYKIK